MLLVRSLTSCLRTSHKLLFRKFQDSTSLVSMNMKSHSTMKEHAADVFEPEAYTVSDKCRFVVDNIAKEIEDPTRCLFAVIYLQMKQLKVMQDDIIHIEHNVPLDVGDEIKLKKVLLVGGTNFTLAGRPLLDPQFVHVNATVIEKTTTSPDVQYNYKINIPQHPLWLSQELTVIRINDIFIRKAILSENVE